MCSVLCAYVYVLMCKEYDEITLFFHNNVYFTVH